MGAACPFWVGGAAQRQTHASYRSQRKAKGCAHRVRTMAGPPVNLVALGVITGRADLYATARSARLHVSRRGTPPQSHACTTDVRHNGGSGCCKPASGRLARTPAAVAGPTCCALDAANRGIHSTIPAPHCQQGLPSVGLPDLADNIGRASSRYEGGQAEVFIQESWHSSKPSTGIPEGMAVAIKCYRVNGWGTAGFTDQARNRAGERIHAPPRGCPAPHGS